MVEVGGSRNNSRVFLASDFWLFCKQAAETVDQADG